MPNFKAKKLKEIILPFQSDGVEFAWMAHNDSVYLIYTRIEQEAFFLQVKKEVDGFIIKVDKHAKAHKIACVHKALDVFKEYFCEHISHEAFKVRKNTHQHSLILNDFEDLLTRLKGRIYIEIGFGSGRHLLYQAKKNPHVLMLGIEIYNRALNQVSKLAQIENIKNILLIEADARLLLSILHANSVEKIFLHFPIPWDKKPHRRIISKAFCKECARVLKLGGRFELRTDSYEYFHFTLKEFLDFSSAKLILKKNQQLKISSKYEHRWKKEKRNIYDLWVWNLDKEDGGVSTVEFDFSDIVLSKHDLILLEQNFKNFTLRGENFFLHFENIYKQGDCLLLKIAFGAFNKPEHSYLHIGTAINFVFKKPFRTQENLRAMQELKENIIFHFKPK